MIIFIIMTIPNILLRYNRDSRYLIQADHTMFEYFDGNLV